MVHWTPGQGNTCCVLGTEHFTLTVKEYKWVPGVWMGTIELSGKLNVMPRGNLVMGLTSHVVVSYPGAGIIKLWSYGLLGLSTDFTFTSNNCYLTVYQYMTLLFWFGCFAVDPQTYKVHIVDPDNPSIKEHITCNPAETIPMAQRFFIF